ncbi:MAG: amidohydrolase family protein, partial [Chlamydiota bacterium]|nr:amidohydrolase family protein [Chlamydiota bacterium]
YKMNPPLGSADDLHAIIKGLQDGTIDAIASDHAPHQSWEKDVEFDSAPFGIVGLETSVSVGLHYLVHQKILTPLQWVDKMSCSPARILNLPGGTLKPGNVADITIIDPQFEYTVKPELFLSKSRNTPFGGKTLKGKAVCTLVDGRFIVKDHKLV